MPGELQRGDPVDLGGYRLSGRLGAGGMGHVCLAFTPGGRPVALKVLRPEVGDDPEFRARFRQEVAAARRVSRPRRQRLRQCGCGAAAPSAQ